MSFIVGRRCHSLSLTHSLVGYFTVTSSHEPLFSVTCGSLITLTFTRPISGNSVISTLARYRNVGSSFSQTYCKIYNKRDTSLLIHFFHQHCNLINVKNMTFLICLEYVVVNDITTQQGSISIKIALLSYSRTF